ncbi:hypothetical protein H5368_09440 [Luteimonas sp. MC1782]|uniref:hypothetical protein n=1 Tax=Luteimonas sp. MC1782 TaxID=2760305 RepID=UPI0015FF2312|nr:hypothetical protein [Luteimonas sp. MC1782]MBB1473256.1 hypothetical protein [Luteimonas sp. MC1782]
MRKFFGLLLLIFVPPADSSEMAAVSSDAGFCGRAEDKSAMCYEWLLNSSPSIRFVAYGYEDGIEYSFYTLLPSDTYEHIIRVYPVIRDSSRNDALFWGYPWDIRDIAHSNGKGQKRFLASFEHNLFDDGEVHSPSWQRRVPAVLFIGRTTQPAMTVPQLKFKASALSGLRTAAGG